MNIYHYFNDTADEINIIQENKPCALNYVIVISDGFINNTEAGSRAINQIKSLRQDMDVKTLFVAYGGTYDDERAKRRKFDSNSKDSQEIELHTLKELIKKRDFEDSNREISPLKKANDAIEILTDGYSINEVVDKIIDHYNDKIPKETEIK